MHARVISETEARKGLFGRCAQPERSFWRMCATDFWATDARKVWGKSRMRTTYIPDVGIPFKGGPEPSNLGDLCLVNVSVKYFSKLCFGTINIQPELKYLKTILEVLTSWFQRAKAWEHEFGGVPSISFIFTGSKMARICKGIKYKYFERIECQISSWTEDRSLISRSCIHAWSGFLFCDIYVTIDWCCFYYFLRNSLVALLEAIFKGMKKFYYRHSAKKCIK